MRLAWEWVARRGIGGSRWWSMRRDLAGVLRCAQNDRFEGVVRDWAWLVAESKAGERFGIEE